MSFSHKDRLDEVVVAAMSGQRIYPDESVRGPRLRLISINHAQITDIVKIRHIQQEILDTYGLEFIVIGGGAGCFTIEILVRNPKEDAPGIATDFIRKIGNDPLLLDRFRNLGVKIVISEYRDPDQQEPCYYERNVIAGSGSDGSIDISIVTALSEPEFSMLRRRLYMVAGNETQRYIDKLDAYEYCLAQNSYSYTKVLATYLQNVGTLSAAMETLRILNAISPKYLFFVGIAGRIGDSDLKPGDVVVGEQVFHYDVRRKTSPDRTEYAPEVHRCDSDLLRVVRRALQDSEFRRLWCQDLFWESPQGPSHPKAVIGDIACGDEVVNSQERNREVASINRKFLAVDTESAGMIKAIEAFERPVKPLVIRAVSDLADGTKNDQWQSYASETAAAFAAHLVKRFWRLHGQEDITRETEDCGSRSVHGGQ